MRALIIGGCLINKCESVQERSVTREGVPSIILVATPHMVYCVLVVLKPACYIALPTLTASSHSHCGFRHACHLINAHVT